MTFHSLHFIRFFAFSYSLCLIHAFATFDHKPELSVSHHYQSKLDSPSADSFSRREIVILAIGGSAYAKVVSTAISKVKRGDAYPQEHEDRVSKTFKRTISEASSSISLNDMTRPLRVLEVGIGSSCRTILRGLYDDALLSLSKMTKMTGIDITGVDIDTPSEEILTSAQSYLSKVPTDFPSTLKVFNADIMRGLPEFPDGYFDAITCSLVLCSVEDQAQALSEIKRLLNPNGGAFGFVEHVAVDLNNDDEKNLSFLEFQQKAFDPLQQAVAHNCHLHRQTENVISSVFGIPESSSAEMLEKERFLVKDMWPVSCQVRGVVKFIT